jgi:hypothetical protein
LSFSNASIDKKTDLSEFLKLGFVIENFPLNSCVDIKKLVSKPIPLPKKLLSLTPKPRDVPDVPAPADAKISPVGFSSI